MLLIIFTLTSVFLQNNVHSSESIQKSLYSLDEAPELFEHFIKEYNKKYEDKEKEERFKIFVHNLEKINFLNEKNTDSVFGINKFSDLTKEEFIRFHTGFKLDTSWDFEHQDTEESESIKFNAPEEFDWRSKGVVSSVKDQGDCLSCWAFSASGNVESIYAIKNDRIIDVSEQQLVDCAPFSEGCSSGGLPWAALSYFVKKGAMSLSSYPYVGVDETCRYDISKVVIRLKGYKHITNLTEDEIKEHLYNIGPLSIAIASESIGMYTGGIVKEAACSEDTLVNHAVLLVGYGKEKNIPYWILKNSWNAHWGENGYFRIQRGVNCLSLTTMGISTAVI